MASEAGLKERFFRYFQYEVTALNEQMERLALTPPTGGERADAVEHCLAGINRLSHEVKDASAYIPAYDQRTYADAIKGLSEKLQTTRNAFAPPKKFQFKSTRKTNSAAAPTTSSLTSLGEEKRGLEAMEQPASSHTTDSSEKSAGVAVSNHIDSHVVLPASSSHTASSAIVSNIRHSVVDLSSAVSGSDHFATLTLKNVKDSLIICGHILGPIHMTGVENSVLVMACRQFRMHGSRNVDVYLHCSSRPIIEDCQGIRFGPLSSTHV
jgi:hypothetical protein